jgi:hypothetical protein
VSATPRRHCACCVADNGVTGAAARLTTEFAEFAGRQLM